MLFILYLYLLGIPLPSPPLPAFHLAICGGPCASARNTRFPPTRPLTPLCTPPLHLPPSTSTVRRFYHRSQRYALYRYETLFSRKYLEPRTGVLILEEGSHRDGFSRDLKNGRRFSPSFKVETSDDSSMEPCGVLTQQRHTGTISFLFLSFSPFLFFSLSFFVFILSSFLLSHPLPLHRVVNRDEAKEFIVVEGTTLMRCLK